MSTSAEEQIGLLEELKSYLNRFQENLLAVSDKYQNKVDSLDSTLLQDIHRKFLEEELQPARDMISKLCDLINESSLPAVQKRIGQLENILNDQ